MPEQHDFEPVRVRREALYQGMLDLEQAIAAPLADGEMWLKHVAAVADQVRDLIDEHVADTEQAGGFLQSIVSEAPRLASRVTRMEREHVDLRHEAGHLVRVVEANDPSGLADGGASEIRRQATDLLGALTRHRQRGADLIYEAYEVDLGGHG